MKKIYKKILNMKLDGYDIRDDVVEWDVTERIVSGNVFYGIRNDIEASENEY